MNEQLEGNETMKPASGLMSTELATRTVIETASEDTAIGDRWKFKAQEIWDRHELPPGLTGDPHDMKVIGVGQELAKFLKAEWALPPGIGRWTRTARRMRKLFKKVDYFVVALAVLTSIGKEHSEI